MVVVWDWREGERLSTEREGKDREEDDLCVLQFSVACAALHSSLDIQISSLAEVEHTSRCAGSIQSEAFGLLVPLKPRLARHSPDTAKETLAPRLARRGSEKQQI